MATQLRQNYSTSSQKIDLKEKGELIADGSLLCNPYQNRWFKLLSSLLTIFNSKQKGPPRTHETYSEVYSYHQPKEEILHRIELERLKAVPIPWFI